MICGRKKISKPACSRFPHNKSILIYVVPNQVTMTYAGSVLEH